MSRNNNKESLLELLKKRPVIGDGSYVITLEKRGYVKAGSWTPEAVIENPEAVKQLHRDYRRAGADVLQVFSFYASDSKLQTSDTGRHYTSAAINETACKIMEEVADQDTYICGGISPTPAYKDNLGKEASKAEFRKQCQVFNEFKVDVVLGEFFGHVEEAEWAIEAMKELGIPVACTMRVGPTGDKNDVPAGECAVRMARAGADLVGINCQYDLNTFIKTLKLMKAALDKENLHPVLMVQPLGYHCPEVENAKDGYHELPEFPYCLEPRLVTRFDCRRFVREAYDLGVRYFGGCCGMEPYHIREMAEELAEELGHRPPGHDKTGPFGEAMAFALVAEPNGKIGRDYWMNLVPATGRPNNPSASQPASEAKK